NVQEDRVGLVRYGGTHSRESVIGNKRFKAGGFHPDSESHRDLFVILNNEDSFQARPPFSALPRMRESARRTPGRAGEGVSDKADECVGVVWLEQQADGAAFDGLSTQLRVLTGSGDNNRDGASFGHSAQVFGQIE